MATIVRTILTVLFVIDCIALVVVILMQHGKDQGLGALSGMSTNSNTYWEKNKGRSAEGRLIRLTRILAIVFVVVAVVLNVKF